MAETTVRMQVTLDWQGEHLRVVIKNRPEDRNYVVFLVVEETFGSIEPDEVAPKVLHTALPIHINGRPCSTKNRQLATNSEHLHPGSRCLSSPNQASLSLDRSGWAS
jgi:hypothetical protein